MEEAAAEEGDGRVGLTLTFEGWKAEKRAMWEQRKTFPLLLPSV